MPTPAGPVRDNEMFARDGRCLLFASYSQSLRDCQGCRIISWCKYYDHAGLREYDRLLLAKWEDEGGQPPPAA
jgi:hypothetical protein